VIVPDIAYRFIYPKDTSGPTMELFAQNFFESDTDASIVININGIPKDRALIISNVTMNGQPGAAQTIDRLTCAMFTHAGVGFNIVDAFPLLAATERAALNWAGEAWALGRGGAETTVRFTAGFNAGVAINSLGVGVSGFLVPRANLSVF